MTRRADRVPAWENERQPLPLRYELLSLGICAVMIYALHRVLVWLAP